MLRFYAAEYDGFMGQLAHLSRLLKQEYKPDNWRELFIAIVETVGSNLERLPVGRVVRSQYADLKKRAETEDDADKLSLPVDVFCDSMTADLEGQRSKCTARNQAKGGIRTPWVLLICGILEVFRNPLQDASEIYRRGARRTMGNYLLA